jgi:Leucine-rich repeat (LRR) protein
MGRIFCFLLIVIATGLSGLQAQGIPDSIQVFTDLSEALKSPDEVKAFSFSRSKIKTLPADLNYLTHLEYLDLSRCDSLVLENAFEVLANFVHLKYLDISWIKVGKLPENISKLKHLEGLNLKDCRLIDLPGSFAQLNQLTYLNLRHNYAFNERHVFKMIGKLEGLKVLDLSFCQLNSLPDFFGKLQELSTLNLEGNGIVKLPQSLAGAGQLRKLDLTGNYQLGEVVNGVPEMITLQQQETFTLLSTIGSLEELILSGCYLKEISAFIGKLNQIKNLDLSKNLLESLPDAIGQLTYLESLDLSNSIKGQRLNKISSLPASFSNLRNLRILNLTANEFTVLKFTKPGQLSNLEVLKMDWNRLTEFPDVVRSLTGLRQIHFNVNLITEIPEWIGELQNLEQLMIDGDFFLNPKYKIKVLPAEIGKLINLEVLSLNDQVIEKIPVEIGNLAQLHTLNIRDNLLSKIPDEIGNLKQLKYLDLKANEIKNLPATIGNCEKLTYLNMSFNLPFYSYNEINRLIECRNLKELDISFTVPISLAQLKEMRKKLEGVTIIYAYTNK